MIEVPEFSIEDKVFKFGAFVSFLFCMQVYLSTPVVRFRETIETADDDDDWMPGNGGPVFRKTTGRDLKLCLGLKLAGTSQSCDDTPLSSLRMCRPLFHLFCFWELRRNSEGAGMSGLSLPAGRFSLQVESLISCIDENDENDLKPDRLAIRSRSS